MLCFPVVFVLGASNRQLLLLHQRGCRGEHPVQICVVGLNHHHGGGLIPSTTTVPSAGLFGQALNRVSTFVCAIVGSGHNEGP